MKEMFSTGLKLEGGKLLALDQQLLPDKEIWLEARTPHEMAGFILDLKVRGAPLIGVAAALALAKYAEDKRGNLSMDDFNEAAHLLRAARPTAVNLMWAVDRMIKAAGRGVRPDAGAVIIEAESIFEEDVALCAAIAKNGAALVAADDHILTHCNAGGLATAGIGTALGIIIQAHRDGKKIHVFVDETRPLLQGGRLTTWELNREGVPHTLICDNMAASLMRKGRIQKIFVGADRIAINGDFANKVGTYSVAVNAAHHGVPFYPAAPYSTIDFNCPDGNHIPIEERPPFEVRGAMGSFGKVRWSPENTAVYNPAFDVTPVSLVTGLVLDKGFFTREELLKSSIRRLGK